MKINEDDKKWNEGFKVAVKQCIDVINRADILQRRQKNIIRKRMAYLIKRVNLVESKLKLCEVK
jgi:hypothetical protein